MTAWNFLRSYRHRNGAKLPIKSCWRMPLPFTNGCNSGAQFATFPIARFRGRSLNNASARRGQRPTARTCSPGISLRSAIPTKCEIRVAAEIEEKEFYTKRAPKEWLAALAPLGTDSSKPFLETAPWLIAIFVQPYRILADGTRGKTYYAIESVGIATGLLVTAVHSCGLASLTHTPSPMGFLNRILGRPQHEKPFLLLVVGHPTNSAMVPNISRKSLEEISSFRT